MVITVIGILVALLAFIVGLFSSKDLAENIFMVGFIIALIGTAISIKGVRALFLGNRPRAVWADTY